LTFTFTFTLPFRFSFLRALPWPKTLSIGEPERNRRYRQAICPKRKADATDSFAAARDTWELRVLRIRIEDKGPIAAFRCGNAVMERDMRQALRAGRYPSIEFRFKELRGVIEHDIDRNEYGAVVAGELTMAGVRKEIELPVVAQRLGRDRFRIRAEMPLRMTDFGVKPPTALFGIVKAHDDLVVRFDLTMQVAS